MISLMRLRRFTLFTFSSILILSGCGDDNKSNLNIGEDNNSTIISIDNNIERNNSVNVDNNITETNNNITIDSNITEVNTTTIIDNNSTDTITPPIDSNRTEINNTTPNNIKITGKVIDGEIAGATLFLDLNLNSELDTDEPKTKTEKDGTFILILNTLHQNHQNYLNQIAPLIAFNGRDIRTDKIFEDYLMSMTEGKNKIYVTPLTTLIAQTVMDELSQKSKSSLSYKSTEEILSDVQTKIDAIKQNLSELFNIKKTLLTKDPITLAKQGESKLLNTSLQIHNTSKNMKKAMKKEVRDLKKSILSSYKALGKELKKLDKEAVKSGDNVLSKALDLAMTDSNLFDGTLVETVKKETKEIIKNINDYWNEQKEILDDKELTETIKEGEKELTPDTTKPVISLLGDATINILKDATYSDAGATATDNIDGDISDKITVNNTLDTSKAGTYIITYSVKDSAGNLATPTTRTVIVSNPVVPDTTKPIISLLGDATVNILKDTNYSDAGATATDNIDGDISDKITVNNTLDTSKAGTYIITYSVKDSAGNLATPTTRTVIVSNPVVPDTTKPIISLLGEATVTIFKDAKYSDAGATATDNIDGDISDKITVNNTLDTSKVGTYIITYSVKDSAGNLATPVTRTVIVSNPVVPDTIKPIISLIGEATVTIFKDSNYSDAGATATDNIDGDISDKITVNNTVDSSKIGTYIVTYNVTDSAGNQAIEIKRVVNIIDSEEYSYIPKNIDDASAVRFLNKASFGANKTEVESLKSGGVISWVNTQLEMPDEPTHRHLRRTIVLAKKFEPANNPETVNAYLADNDVVFNKSVASFQMRRYQMSAWFETAMNDKDQLRNKMAYALSQIIVESLAEPIFTRRAEALADYFDILTRNALGNYKDLLLDISHSASMSLYLTFNGNKKVHEVGTTTIYPDENYAREIMQLFTIGLYKLNIDGTPELDENGKTIPTYTQEDITEIARIFTGWDIQRNPRYGLIGFTRGDLTHPVELTKEYHDSEAKTVLGQTIPAGLEASVEIEKFIDILMSHQNIAPFISKQLIMRLVKSNPSKEYVARVANVFNDNGEGIKGDLKAVVKAIFLDQEFWTDTSSQKFKEPIIAWTQLLRAVNAQNYDKFRVKGKDFDIEDAFFINNPSLGESPSRAFSVFNFYSNDYIPNDDYFKSNSLVAPELQIQSDSVLIKLNNYFAYNLKRQEKRHPNGWGNLNRDRYLVDCSEEYDTIEKELEGSVDKKFEPLNGITREKDTSADENGTTNRDRAVKALIELVDRKLTGSRTPDDKKALLFEHFKEAFYETKLIKADDPELKIYENIIVPIIVAIATSEINMVE